jgi:TPR repeat protein
MLEEGNGVDKNLALAAKYFRLSAQQNYPPGQKNYDRLRTMGFE